MANAGGTPNTVTTPGISFFETESTVYWANDSLSLPIALSAEQVQAVQAGLEAKFGKPVVQVTTISEAIKRAGK